MKKFAFAITAAMFLLSQRTLAHCPLCTAGVGAAAVSASYMGLDASIIGVFIGAFGISTGIWVGKKIKQYIRFQLPIVVAASFLLTVIPLMNIIEESFVLPMLWLGPPGTVLNKVYFIDKILFGSIIGGITSFGAYWIHLYVKKSRGKVLVPFQGVIFTIVMLVLASLILFLTVGD